MTQDNKIPSKVLKQTPFLLAPMDEVTDIGFRTLCEEEGSAYGTTELTSVDALVRDRVMESRYKKENLKINSIQLFGHNPQTFVDAAKKVKHEADFIDINFGCPSACVNSNDSGAILLKDPKNVRSIVEKLVKEVDRPITAKIRLGYEKTTYLDVAREVEEAGASMLAVHGRTAKQKYSGKANWDAIQEIYDKTDIFLCGNGDITKPEQIDEYMGSHCDALMIGRGAIGNPKIFKDFLEYKNNKNQFLKKQEELKELSREKRDEIKKREQKEYFLRYLHHLKHITLQREVYRIQHQAMYFFKGISGVKELRQQLMQVKTIDEVIKLVEEF
ncbi:MAG: tRNA-dihydrouridine synthase family protein [Nanoarchaeota archaeon]|nr:tRNA-dihydrouridine synthase family protein [Nanoarchaeota archaeon]